jgi:hypothetical protein
MKFMFIVKSAHSVAPTPALLEAMHKLANREIKAGRWPATSANKTSSSVAPPRRPTQRRHRSRIDLR